MNFKDLITGFAAQLGLSDVNVDDDIVSISVDDFIVNIQNLIELNKIIVYAEIAERPPDDDGLLAEVLLQSNYMYRGTGGGTISQDPETKKYYFTRIDDLAVVTVESFVEQFEKLTNYLENWRKIIADYRPAARSTAAAADSATDAPANNTGDDWMMRI